MWLVGRMVVAAAMVLLASSRLADARTGVVHIKFAKAAAIFGVGRGSGTLHFDGRNYRLRISGITAGTIGVALIRLKGHAYHLRSVADIGGTYTVASVSLAIGAGGKVARLQKSNSIVYLQLEGRMVGLDVSTALAGITITLQ